MKVSVVVPAYNEDENLPVLVPRLDEALAKLGCDYEMLVVNDGSTDGTSRVLRDLVQRFPKLRAVEFAQNAGESAGWHAGFRLATGDVVVTMDADLQNDPQDIPVLLAALQQADCVSGVRQKREDNFVRRVSSRIANTVRNWVTHDRTTDVGCSLRAVRREFLVDLPFFQHMHRFLPALLQLQGARCVEAPVRHHPRVHGQSKYGTWGRLWAGIVDLLAVRWMMKRWIRYEVQWDSASGRDRLANSRKP